MSLPIYTIDVETDPFQYNRVPAPFAVGFYDGADYVHFWGDDCIDKMYGYLQGRPRGIIFAHNGGRFDIYQGMMKWIVGSPLRIINNRIVQAEIQGTYVQHQLRDSWSIMPYKLANMKGGAEKLDIDIRKLERRCRESHRAEIVEYLGMDVISLHEKVSRFFERFGDYLTVGSMAMHELKERHEFEELDKQTNDDIRQAYYYGARVECFEKGHLFGDFSIYDVNSMYPYVMKEYAHPIGGELRRGRRVTDNTFFLKVQGKPTTKIVPFLSYAFEDLTQSWAITRHEFDAAVECGLFDVHRVMETIDVFESGVFDTFVNDFYAERLECKARLDFVGEMLAKFALNSGYGKFAQDSMRYKDWLLTDGSYDCSVGGWDRRIIYNGARKQAQYVLWDRPSERNTVYNSAIGASITGAARSVLLRALAKSERPVYCDTDSIACASLPNDAVLDSKQLGAWKLEASADEACICGRKTYAFFKDGARVKAANKGVPTWNPKTRTGFSDKDFRAVANGRTVTISNDAPTYKLDGTVNFITREIRMT